MRGTALIRVVSPQGIKGLDIEVQESRLQASTIQDSSLYQRRCASRAYNSIHDEGTEDKANVERD